MGSPDIAMTLQPPLTADEHPVTTFVVTDIEADGPSPLDASVINMTIAGDWTECGFNEGCIEAAVMSGMLASHAICGFPALEDIVGYDHP